MRKVAALCVCVALFCATGCGGSPGAGKELPKVDPAKQAELDAQHAQQKADSAPSGSPATSN